MPNWANEEEWGEVIDSRARFRYLSVKLAHFWDRWKKEYLCDVHEYHNCRSSGNTKAVEVGDVIVSGEGKKRNEWRTVIVEELVSGRDEVVRGLKLRT